MTGKPASWRDTLPIHPACDFKMSPDRLAAGFQQAKRSSERASVFTNCGKARPATRRKTEPN